MKDRRLFPDGPFGGEYHHLAIRIIEGLGESYAMVNGAIVGIGETVGKATVERIENSRVILRQPDGTSTTLRLSR
jgi:hypothetical protein